MKPKPRLPPCPLLERDIVIAGSYKRDCTSSHLSYLYVRLHVPSLQARGRCDWLHYLPLARSFQKLLFLPQPMKSPTRSELGLRSCDIIFWVISATRCSCSMYRTWIGRYIYPSSNRGGYLLFPLATGEVCYYNCIVRLSTLPSSTSTICQG